MKFETKAVHSGAQPDAATGAIAPPIQLSTTFERNASDGQAAHGYSYIRDHNPTQTRLESALAAIDSAEAALVFGSGMAAASAAFQALPSGSHVILPDDGYYAVRILAADFFSRWQLTSDLVAMTDVDRVRQAIRKETRAIWCESPSNPLMKIADIAEIARIAHDAKAILIADGTFATPALQRPIELGADLVMHSTTKYLGGHSDVQGGSLAFRRRDELFEKVEHVRTIIGGVASPFNSWLVLRGIRSLAPRMRLHCENARAVADFLSKHPRIEAVHYPGLASDPGHAIAARQMSDFGGMLSLRVKGGREEALAVASKVRVFTRATSLGGVESLIEHRQSSEGPTSKTPPNLLRVSVGLEHKDDLIADLDQALK
ncbi:MAG TPA: aminotransferase class I/II-fold pyridoxal phosphate-dependent enzyme [Thermoanaerobaculia bacterium]|nr:aminotransferase class I/II-fold pyridoxal phosphate-dependent enzyme [Thermoanaerobaculia bacterium]